MTVEQQYEMQAVAAAKGAEAEIQSAYIMALKKPRNEEDARIAIMRTCGNKRFAQKAMYSKPVGGKNIVGPSIRLVEELIRQWGNIIVKQDTTYEDPVKRVVRIGVIDLESNARYSKESVVEKTVERKVAADREILGERVNTKGERVFIVKATEDELQNKEAANASKIIRNNALRLIPEHITDEAVSIVGETMRAKAAVDPDAERRRVLSQFGELGIMPSGLEQYLGHPIAQVTPDELAELTSIANSIRDGQAKWADFLAQGQQPATPETGDMGRGFTAGDQATHTPAGSSFQKADVPAETHQQAQEQAVSADTPEVLWHKIEAEMNALLSITAGRKKLTDILKTLKAPDAEGVKPDLRPMFLAMLQKARAQ